MITQFKCPNCQHEFECRLDDAFAICPNCDQKIEFERPKVDVPFIMPVHKSFFRRHIKKIGVGAFCLSILLGLIFLGHLFGASYQEIIDAIGGFLAIVSGISIASYLFVVITREKLWTLLFSIGFFGGGALLLGSGITDYSIATESKNGTIFQQMLGMMEVLIGGVFSGIGILIFLAREIVRKK